MALPWELEEDILSRLPPISLVRFRTVSKHWNSLFNDKTFINNHLSRSRPEFIILTNSKIYSVDIIDHNNIDPTIRLHEIPTYDIHSRGTDLNRTIINTCDEFLFYNYRYWDNKTALWNPWLRQVRWIEYANQEFCVFGLGCDNSRPEKVYKILGHLFCHGKVLRDQKVVIYECASDSLRFIDRPEDDDWPITETAKRSNVSLNGNLYWFGCSNYENDEYYIRIFDFSMEDFKPFCLLSCQMSHSTDELVLAVYKGDRFSLLRQCSVTREIGIWVTKERINNNNGNGGEGVEWLKLMTLSKPNLPKLFGTVSYFIYGKTLYMCNGDDETALACIYIVREDVCKKFQIGSGNINCRHCVYTPNLLSLPLFIG
ncbi:unnamed protein product [Arabidopsis thaliana]|uniref:F-box domain-containing protein n=1 Tax=Arabidopsis thaliana TaxID=3702 RepID=A0A654EUW3_ARATH|nr:unnamed protein product [Arabidopsis thaliana]